MTPQHYGVCGFCGQPWPCAGSLEEQRTDAVQDGIASGNYAIVSRNGDMSIVIKDVGGGTIVDERVDDDVVKAALSDVGWDFKGSTVSFTPVVVDPAPVEAVA